MRALALALALVAGQAQALSCLAPDPVTSFNRANDSDLPYIALLGRITVTGPVPAEITAPLTLPARLTGAGLTEEGFTAEFAEEITLNLTCAGPFCGFLPGAEPVLVYARVDEGAPVVDLAPCGEWVFPAPDADLTETLAACMRGEACLAQPLQ